MTVAGSESDGADKQTPAGLSLEAVFEALPQAAALLDEAGRMLAVNQRFQGAFGDGPWAGLALEELVGEPLEIKTAARNAAGAPVTFHAHIRQGAWADREARLTLSPLSGGGALALIETDTGRAGAAAETLDDRHGAREAAASAQMSAWTYEIASRRLHLSGPVLEALGWPGPELELDIEEWRAHVRAEDLAQMDRATQALRSSGVADVEYRVRAADGQAVWLNLRGGVSERGADGEALRYSGFLTEIGARKRLERTLAEREQELTDALDAGLVGIWTYGYESQIQTARGRILDLMGKPRDTGPIKPSDWLALVHRDDHDDLKAVFSALTSGQGVDPVDMRLRTPQGWRWVRTHGAPVGVDDRGQARRAAGVIVDVHAERSLEGALRSQKLRYEALYRQTPAFLHTIDPQGRTISVSDYWLQRMGYERDAVIGAPGWAFMEDESARRIQDEVLPLTLKQGRVENVPVSALTKAGDRLELRLSAFLERDGEGRPVAAHAAFSDVTDLRAAQRALEDHAGALERTNRELNRFATAASHDLQEPLRKISAFASLLRQNLKDTLEDGDAMALEFLVDATGRMRILIDDLLAYSRTSNRALDLEPVDLGPLVRQTLDSLEFQVDEAEAELTLGALPTVTGDAAMLSLVFQNLISNALKYRKGPGVRITIDAAPAAEGQAAITVSDDGIGLDLAFSEKIFEPFARLHTREAYSGTGIGLAICQQAVERLGGRIYVASQPGEGTAFTIHLPLAEAGGDAP